MPELRARTAAAGAAPLALVVLLMAYVLGPGAQVLQTGSPLPELSIERVEFSGSEVRATVRNTGPEPLDIVMADVNDRIQPAAVEPDGRLERLESALVRIPFEWNEGEPYQVGITVSDGTRFARDVGAAAPSPGPGLAGLLALVGTYVGIAPVMIGLLWLPFMRRAGASWSVFFLALTAGLLFFLGIDAAEEALEVSAEWLAPSLNGTMLALTAASMSFVVLHYAGGRAASSGRAPAAAALMLAGSIGLHNLGEGLAIGGALGMGSVAVGASLVAGFALHNVTEGVAIASAALRARAGIARLAMLGLLAGAPAIPGAWAGGFAYSPIASVVFLSVGAGAALQVAVIVSRQLHAQGALSSAPAAAGFAAGMVTMYLTGLAVG